MAPTASGATAPDILKLPDLRRLDQMPSLPEWVVSRAKSMKDECQRSRADGIYKTVLTLPSPLILNDYQRVEIKGYVAYLEVLLGQAPENGSEWEVETLLLLTDMLLVLPSQQQNQVGVEATGRAFIRAALRDVPYWAVKWAIDDWHRGACGENERGEPYDYHWRPAPAELRRVALHRVASPKAQVKLLQNILAAEPRNEFDEDHRAKMLARFAELTAALRKT